VSFTKLNFFTLHVVVQQRH